MLKKLQDQKLLNYEDWFESKILLLFGILVSGKTKAFLPLSLSRFL